MWAANRKQGKLAVVLTLLLALGLLWVVSLPGSTQPAVQPPSQPVTARTASSPSESRWSVQGPRGPADTVNSAVGRQEAHSDRTVELLLRNDPHRSEYSDQAGGGGAVTAAVAASSTRSDEAAAASLIHGEGAPPAPPSIARIDRAPAAPSSTRGDETSQFELSSYVSTVKIVAEVPHQMSAFTQGLAFDSQVRS